MRQNQKNNRMRNRPRKGGGGGNGANPGNNLNRSYESNGPDVKVRGTPHHIAEKYQQLARDATSAGDRVAAENYYQHAEHYLRIIAAAQAQQAEFQERRRLEDERRREEDERWREEQERRRMERQERQDRQAGERQGNERQNGERQERYQDRGAGEQPRVERFDARDDGRQNGQNGQGEPPFRADGPRGQDRQDDDRPRRRRRNGSANEQAGDGQPNGAFASDGQPTGQDGARDGARDGAHEGQRGDGAEGDAPAPRRRRGRKPSPEASQDGGDLPDGQAIAHALPGSGLDGNAGPAEATPADDDAKPKRRRAPARRKAEGSEAPELSAEDA